MTSHVEARLMACGWRLPTPNPPTASFLPWTRAGSLLFVSGQVPPAGPDGPPAGLLGAGVDVEHAQGYARDCALLVLAQVRAALDGDLDRVLRVLKLTVFVAAAPEFRQHPLVGNGASEVMVAAFGDAGRHARSSIGCSSLPSGVPVEVEAVLEVR